MTVSAVVFIIGFLLYIYTRIPLKLVHLCSHKTHPIRLTSRLYQINHLFLITHLLDKHCNRKVYNKYPGIRKCQSKSCYKELFISLYRNRQKIPYHWIFIAYIKEHHENTIKQSFI